jgi:hypothetical protein
MRVRISFDALRLCALVAAGVTSGYLWRAAFESSSPEDVRTAAKPRVVKPAPSPPVVRIPPRHLTQPTRPPARVVTLTVVRPAGQEPATLISSPGVSAPRPRPTPTPVTPTPTPTPTTPAPQSPPPTTTTTPQPAQTPAPVASPPTQSAKPPAPTPPAAQPPQPTTATDSGSRPGWGNGDKNHDHSGPGNDQGGNGPKKP